MRSLGSEMSCLIATAMATARCRHVQALAKPMQEVKFLANAEGIPIGVVCLKHHLLLQTLDPRKTREEQVEDYQKSKASQQIVNDAEQLSDAAPKVSFTPPGAVKSRSAQRAMSANRLRISSTKLVCQLYIDLNLV